MTYADMRPLKQDVGLAIPPPSGFTVPLALRKTYTAAQLETARQDFISKAENSYYSEWFWFPYQVLQHYPHRSSRLTITNAFIFLYSPNLSSTSGKIQVPYLVVSEVY